MYEGVAEPSYKKPTRVDANCVGHVRQNRLEAASLHTYPTMGKSSGKRRKQYADCLLGESKICLICGPGNSSYECKVLGDFGAKYAKVHPNKDCGNHPVLRKKLTVSRKIMPLLIMWWMKSY